MKITMIVIAINLLMSCMFVLSQHVQQGEAVLQASPLQQSPAGAAPVLGELRGTAVEADTSKGVQLRELQVGPRGSISKSPSKRYHEVPDKPKFLPYTQSDGGHARERPKKHQQQQQQDSTSNGKVSYEIKVYIPRPETNQPEPPAERIAASSEISPSRAEPEYMISPQYPYEDRPMPVPVNKYGIHNAASAKALHDTKPYYYVPIYEDPNSPEPRPPVSKIYHPGDREVYKPRLVEVPQQISPEHKATEESARPVTFVEVKPMKAAEPAYPPSYKPKKPLYGTSERLVHDSRDRDYSYVRPNTEAYAVGDYVPYELQQTTDPPVSPSDKENAYYEKLSAEPSYNEVQRSRPPGRGPEGYGYGSGGGYYHPPPPPPPPSYQPAPSYYYVYPYQGSYGQHGSGYYSQGGHGGHGGQYRGQHPRPLYSGYGYAAFAPYR